MRCFVSILIALSTVGMAYGQVGAPLPGPVPPVPFYGPSTSAFDHNGNLLVFDILYSYSSVLPGRTGPPTVKTRLTVITPDGSAKPAVEYDGAFQVVGSGWYA